MTGTRKSGKEGRAKGPRKKTAARAHTAKRVNASLRPAAAERTKAANILENEERFQMLLQHAPAVAVQGYSMEGTTLYWNDASERIYGYPAREATGKNLVDLIIPPEMRDEVRKAIAFMAETGQPIPAAELSLMRKDGSRVAVFSSHAVVTVPGRPPELFCIDVDLTDRKQTEEALRTSELRYKAIVDSQAEFVVRYHPGGILTFVNDTLCRYAKMKREDLLGRSYYPLMHPDDRDAFIRKIEALDRKSPVMVADARVVLPDGRETWHQWTHHAIFDDKGNLVEYQCTGRDITELRKAEERIKESEKKYRTLFESSIDGIFIVDLDGSMIDANPIAYQRLGYTRVELLSLKISKLTAPEFAAKVPDRIKQIQEQGTAMFETGHLRKDGSVMPVEVNSQLLDYEGRPVLFSVVRDIGDRKRAEEKLKESEEKYKFLIETTKTGYVIVDGDGLVVDANAEYIRMSGHDKREDILGRSVVEWTAAYDQERNAEEVKKCSKTGFVRNLELDYVDKDGRFTPIEINATVMRAGDTIRIFTLCRDISERKRAEVEIAERGAMLQQIMDTASVAIGLVDLTGRITHGNRRMAEMFGRTMGELIGCEYVELVHPTDREASRQNMLALLANEISSVDLERHYCRKDGTEFWGHLACRRFHDVHGNELGIIGVVSDISERKRAEKRIKESEKKYRTLFESSTDGIFILDLDGNFIDVNPAAYARLGYTREELLSMNIGMLDTPEYADKVPGRLKQLREQGAAVFESANRRKDGSVMQIEVSARLLEYEGKPVLFSVNRDITERKRAEEKLREKENKYRTLFEGANDGIFIQDETGFTDINQKGADMYGLPKEKLIGRSPAEFSPERQPDGRLSAEVAGEKIRAALNGVPQVFQWRPLRADGMPFDVEITLNRLEVGGKMRLQAIVRDITERKRAEVALRQSEIRFRSIIESASVGILVADVETRRFRYANPEICRMLGYSEQDFLALTATELTIPEEQQASMAGFQAHAEGKLNVTERTLSRKDGSTVRMSINSVRMEFDGLPCLVAFFADITQEQLLEEERLKAQKLESLGTLAGGIAHDFNNLLQGIFGYISMAKLTIDQREKSLAMLVQAEKALHQSVNLTSQLLTFSKGGKPVKKVVDPRPVIENAVKFALSGSRVTYDLSFGRDLCAVEADEGQIGQVVQNIVLNAEQAMPLGGRIEIAAMNVPATRAAGLPLSAPDGLVEIVVRDQGTGIPHEHLPRIFDPYFTTKEKGSGLGLATSYSIVKNHDGMIDVSSVLGKGSTFTVYLPASRAAQEQAAVSASAGRAAGRVARVLVMDDEEIVRVVAGELLRELGHEAEFAENGKSAIEKYRRAMSECRPFDAVILDLTIRGGMGGLETLRKLKDIDPDVKAVVSSGYSDNAETADYKAHGFRSFLKKPYTMEHLQEVLNRLMA